MTSITTGEVMTGVPDLRRDCNNSKHAVNVMKRSQFSYVYTPNYSVRFRKMVWVKITIVSYKRNITLDNSTLIFGFTQDTKQRFPG